MVLGTFIKEVIMLVEYTQFLFDNRSRDDFIPIAIEELKKYLPADERTDEYARSILRLLKREEIHLTDNVTVNLILHVACKNDEKIELTPTELKLVELLASNVNDVVTYDVIINRMWGFGDKELVKVNISHLRRKLGLKIIAIPRIGYMVKKEG